MRSFNNSHEQHTSTSAFQQLVQSKVDIQNKKTLGKNPPPKLPLNRPKAVPSIPSNTVAPPEDKTMTMNTTFRTGEGLSHTEGPNGFKFKGPRQSDYLATIEKGNNPNVGPGSYDPVKPKLSTAITQSDWSR